ncbi:MAG: biotin/lipoyl-containing protein [Chloroflexota bacterium]
MKYITTLDGKEYNIEIIDERHISIDGRVLSVNFESVSGQPVYSLIIDGKSFESYVYETEDGMQVLLRGRLYTLTVEDEREKRLRAAAGAGAADTGEFHLKAPMPGLVVAVSVNDGDQVEKGQTLVILESMKMQNELKSPKAGKVSRIRVKPGEKVEQRQTLLSVQ